VTVDSDYVYCSTVPPDEVVSKVKRRRFSSPLSSSSSSSFYDLLISLSFLILLFGGLISLGLHQEDKQINGSGSERIVASGLVQTASFKTQNYQRSMMLLTTRKGYMTCDGFRVMTRAQKCQYQVDSIGFLSPLPQRQQEICNRDDMPKLCETKGDHSRPVSLNGPRCWFLTDRASAWEDMMQGTTKNEPQPSMHVPNESKDVPIASAEKSSLSELSNTELPSVCCCSSTSQYATLKSRVQDCSIDQETTVLAF